MPTDNYHDNTSKQEIRRSNKTITTIINNTGVLHYTIANIAYKKRTSQTCKLYKQFTNLKANHCTACGTSSIVLRPALIGGLTYKNLPIILVQFLFLTRLRHL